MYLNPALWWLTADNEMTLVIVTCFLHSNVDEEAVLREQLDFSFGEDPQAVDGAGTSPLRPILIVDQVRAVALTVYHHS